METDPLKQLFSPAKAQEMLDFCNMFSDLLGNIKQASMVLDERKLIVVREMDEQRLCDVKRKREEDEIDDLARQEKEKECRRLLEENLNKAALEAEKEHLRLVEAAEEQARIQKCLEDKNNEAELVAEKNRAEVVAREEKERGERLSNGSLLVTEAKDAPVSEISQVDSTTFLLHMHLVNAGKVTLIFPRGSSTTIADAKLIIQNARPGNYIN